MANTNHATPNITTHAKRAIELYLHGLAVYAAYPERRTAEHMYEIRRVSEAFNDDDHIAYNSNEAQRQWWMKAHNAFADVITEAGGDLLPTFDKGSESSLHAINHPHGSLSQNPAFHGQLDQLPETATGNEGDSLTECKTPETEGAPVFTAFATRDIHQPETPAVSAFVTPDFHQPVEASTGHNPGAENGLPQPPQKSIAELSTAIENLSFEYSYRKLEHTGKNTQRSAADEVATSHMNADRPTQAARPSFAEQKLAMMQDSTFKELDEAKGAVKFHLGAAVDLCIAARDGLNLLEILTEHMKRALLETDPLIRSHSLEDCVGDAASVLDETKARFCETSHALLFAQMEREALDRKIEFAQMDFIEERGKRKRAQGLLATAVDKAEKTMLENHRLKKDLIFLRAELDSKTTQ
ncbi:MAG: hypothetical protein Q9195_003628 [Heterodermia aff. obscurata]